MYYIYRCILYNTYYIVGRSSELWLPNVSIHELDSYAYRRNTMQILFRVFGPEVTITSDVAQCQIADTNIETG